MSESSGFNKVKDDCTKRLNQMVANSKGVQGAFDRIYAVYQQLQQNRFESQNASEGAVWEPLNPEYEKYKPRRYGGGKRRKSRRREAGTWQSWPGQGRKMMIGTSTLAGAVIGPGSPYEGSGNHQVMFTPTSMIISVNDSGSNAEGANFDYPKYVAAKRPFMTFSQPSIDQMSDIFRKYILGEV
jgi:hypothetical protein